MEKFRVIIGYDNYQIGNYGSVYNTKLTDDKVIDARTKYSTGNYSIRQLADDNGVHKSTMTDVIKRNTWKHI